MPLSNEQTGKSPVSESLIQTTRLEDDSRRIFTRPGITYEYRMDPTQFYGESYRITGKQNSTVYRVIGRLSSRVLLVSSPGKSTGDTTVLKFPLVASDRPTNPHAITLHSREHYSTIQYSSKLSIRMLVQITQTHCQWPVQSAPAPSLLFSLSHSVYE